MKLSAQLDKGYHPHPIDWAKLKTHIEYLNRAVTTVQKKYGYSAPLGEQELDQALKEFESRLEHNNWTGYPWHRASGLLRSFFTAKASDSAAPYPDADEWSEVATVLLKTLKATDKKSYCRAAFEVYLKTYQQPSAVLDRLRNILQQKPPEDIPVKRALVTEHKLLDPESAHSHIGALLARNQKPYDHLKSLGVASPHAAGLFAQAFAQMLQENQSARKALEPSAFAQVQNWLSPDNKTRLTNGKALALGIDAIVLPFNDNKGHNLLDEVLKFLVERFKDPRIHRHQWAWDQLSEPTRKIVGRWLTSKSLEMFFDIIDKFEDSHMWQPRKEFWSAIDKRGWISAAWVILNQAGCEFAKSLAIEHRDETFRSHGRLDFSEKKCFFLMKVGDLTIAEGTHSFAVRIFKKHAKNAPQLFHRSYKKDQIYADPESGEGARYDHDPYQNWRQKIEYYMRRHR